jgi:hypothetical protein
MTLDLGHNHPDFTYTNDQLQAKWALLLMAFAAAIICSMILVTVLS